MFEIELLNGVLEEVVLVVVVVVAVVVVVDVVDIVKVVVTVVGVAVVFGTVSGWGTESSFLSSFIGSSAISGDNGLSSALKFKDLSSCTVFSSSIC